MLAGGFWSWDFQVLLLSVILSNFRKKGLFHSSYLITLFDSRSDEWIWFVVDEVNALSDWLREWSAKTATKETSFTQLSSALRRITLFSFGYVRNSVAHAHPNYEVMERAMSSLSKMGIKGFDFLFKECENNGF